MTLTLLDVIVLGDPDTIIVDDFNIHSHQSINPLDKETIRRKGNQIILHYTQHGSPLLKRL